MRGLFAGIVGVLDRAAMRFRPVDLSALTPAERLVLRRKAVRGHIVRIAFCLVFAWVAAYPWDTPAYGIAFLAVAVFWVPYLIVDGRKYHKARLEVDER